ncbi:MAG: hypothetical protein L0206_08240 [Actinobacteria bacterium]|nr:hypothetical protein [Actinomycetota bacterium]
MNASLEIPAELADAELVALVLPFGEDVDRSHPDAPRRYAFGDVALPRRPVPLRQDHDGREVGLLYGFVAHRATGIWARVKIGKTASSMLGRGAVALSAEIDDGVISGASLVTDGRPAFPSARLFDGPTGAVLDVPEAPLRFGLSPVTGRLAFFRPPAAASDPSPPARSTGNITEANRVLESHSMRAVQREIESRRREFARRQEELAREPLEREERALLAAGVPKSQWPAHTEGRRQWDAFEAAQAAEAVAVDGAIAARDFAERMERLQARAARPWWRRWWK